MYTLETGNSITFLNLAVHVVWSKAVHLYSMLKTGSPYSKTCSPCLYWWQAVHVSLSQAVYVCSEKRQANVYS
jgi:hypothetical protein